MKLLVVKMSSMGDVVHALPGLLDASRAIADLEVDWVVEEGFAAIPGGHPAVRRTIPIGMRRWRRTLGDSLFTGEVGEFLEDLRGEPYDLVLDAQGLLKSALVALVARGPVTGFDRHSAREPLASRFYGRGVSVDRAQHAVLRQRQLFAGALGYPLQGDIDYGYGVPLDTTGPVMLIHGTSWPSKHWPLAYWQSLARLVLDAGHRVQIPAGSDAELARAEAIAAGTTAEVLPRMPLAEVMGHIKASSAAVAVDTGLAHLATAYGKPLVTLYGPTDPSLTGTLGMLQSVEVSNHLDCIPCKQRDCQYPDPGEDGKLHPPCFEPITPEVVWQALLRQIGKATQPLA